jgi:uncharacterized protein (UPF0332 family)
MAFDFNKYESFAKLFAECNHEEGLRNSVSRAYYSYYHKVKSFMQIPNKTYMRHEELIRKLSEMGGKGAWLSKSMQTMKEEREQADYYAENHPYKERIIFDKRGVSRFWIRYENAVKTLLEQHNEE